MLATNANHIVINVLVSIFLKGKAGKINFNYILTQYIENIIILASNQHINY